MSSVDVLVARIAPGFITASSWRNTACLTAMSSNAASIDDVGIGDGGVVAAWSVIRPMARGPSLACVRLPARDRRRVVLLDQRAPARQAVGVGVEQAAPGCRRWRSTSRCRRPSCRRRSTAAERIASACRSADRPGMRRGFALGAETGGSARRAAGWPCIRSICRRARARTPLRRGWLQAACDAVDDVLRRDQAAPLASRSSRGCRRSSAAVGAGYSIAAFADPAQRAGLCAARGARRRGRRRAGRLSTTSSTTPSLRRLGRVDRLAAR